MGSEAVDSCRDLLATGLSQAAGSWGRFHLPEDVFAAKAVELVSRRLFRGGVAVTPASLREAMSRTALADIALAIACSEGVPGAWEALVGGLSPRLAGLARKHGASDADARSLAADVLSEMSVPAARAGARRPIDSYEGAGSLFGWAAVILVRRLQRARQRHGGRDVASGGAAPSAAEEPADRGHADPAAALADEDTVRRFRSALEAAWTDLSGRERFALSCRYLDGTPQTRIAVLLGVSEPHTSRILATAVARLKDAVETALGPEASGLGGARTGLVEALRRHLVSTSAVLPLPLGDLPRSREAR